MRHIKYFLQFLFISFLLIFFMIIGLKFSRIVASKLFSMFGPFFRSKKTIEKNISFAFYESDKKFKKEINFLTIDLIIQNEKKLIELLTK